MTEHDGRPRDTSPEVHDLQLALYQQLSPQRKLEIVFDLSAAVDALLEAGIRERNPGIDGQTLRGEMRRLKYGRSGP